ncbi:MAG TPA: PilN domain-containing protein [Xanthobacteraceae bacterium]|jgi:general secretion pathway protein L|nr:PilN domain-containing protein [Xanthobacteraceae bacterium]
MNILGQIGESFSRWIDSVAGNVHSLLDRWFGSHRRVQLIEVEPDTFTLHALRHDPDELQILRAKAIGKVNELRARFYPSFAPGTAVEAKEAKEAREAREAKEASLPDQRIRIGQGAVTDTLSADWLEMLHGSRAELVLRPDRFMFRPLELPKRAAEFLEGIVRAQIDRLTPWTVSEAVYSWTPPTEAANDRIQLTVAATARAVVAPYVQALADLGAASIVVSTVPQDAVGGADPLKVFEQQSRGRIEVTHIRRSLMLAFAVTAAMAVVSIGVSSIAADSLDSEQQALSSKITARRAAMRLGQDGGGALRMLERRKQTTPASVIVLEALSKVLPDHTFVTELRIEGGKVQVTGLTRDAPSLVRLIEQSPHFEHAAFFAPSTQSPGEPGERFHIEARIKPHFRLDT